MKNIWKTLLLLLVVSTGCKDDWNDFYGEEEDERIAGAKITILEALKQQPERYSKFLKLLEETGLDREINSERVVTVWAPSDNYITQEAMSLDSVDKRRFVMNHINQLALYKTKLGSKDAVKTLAEKYVAIQGYGNNFTVDKIKITSFDNICKNGVYHEIAGILTPTKNLMEYIMECGPDYSIYRDSLLAYNDTVFRPDLSFALGVDDVGQTIYDSVFDITNKLLGDVDFKLESGSYTLLLASNAVIEDMLKERYDYLDYLGIPMTHKDTMDCYSFLMKGSFIDYGFSNFYGVKRLTTGGGSQLRLDKQLISSNYDKCSNGYVYKFEKFYVPIGSKMKKLSYVPVDMFLFPEAEWSNYYQLYNGGTIPNIEKNNGDEPNTGIYADNSAPSRKFLSVQVDKAGDWVDLFLVQKNVYAEMERAKLIPGKYKLSGWSYGYRSADVKIYINGAPVRWRNTTSTTIPMGGNTEFEYGAIRLITDTIYVGPKAGPDVVRLETTGTGSLNNCIRLKELLFEPVGDNY